jgi:hypothetical protein
MIARVSHAPSCGTFALPREAEVAGALSLQPPISYSSRHTARIWSVLG